MSSRELKQWNSNYSKNKRRLLHFLYSEAPFNTGVDKLHYELNNHIPNQVLPVFKLIWKMKDNFKNPLYKLESEKQVWFVSKAN